MEVLFEDNHLIALNKKPGEIIHSDKTGDKPLSESVKDYLKNKYNKPGAAFIGVVHRIDRPVSGVVLFARTSKALIRMNELFREKKIKKTYWAVVKNKPPTESGTLIHYLKKDEKNNKSKSFEKEVPGSLRSWLDFKVIGQSDNYFLIEVAPQTGRHHQIRVQLASIGCPIKGDVKYGYPRTNEDGSIHLHAKRVDFIHPVRKNEMTVIATAPNEVIWNFFEEKMAQISI